MYITAQNSATVIKFFFKNTMMTGELYMLSQWLSRQHISLQDFSVQVSERHIRHFMEFADLHHSVSSAPRNGHTSAHLVGAATQPVAMETLIGSAGQLITLAMRI